MRVVAIVVSYMIVLGALVAPLPATLVGTDDPDDFVHDGRKWVYVAGYDVPESMVNRAPNAGAHGASVVGFRISREVQGSMIITVIDRPALAAFVGWGVEDRYINKAAGDLRAVFETSDGNVHVVKFAAGGGHGLLFHSPDNVDIATITNVALYHDKKAKWAR